MPEWLTIAISIIGLLGTVLGVLGISGYLGERAKHKAEVKNRQEDKNEQQLQEAANLQLQTTIKEAFKEEVLPISEKLDDIGHELEEIKEDLSANTVGTVTILRDRMKAILDDCRADGSASTNTKGNWHELYKTYKDLGGNHFKEYVDAWKQELDDLPATSYVTNTATKRASHRAAHSMIDSNIPVNIEHNIVADSKAALKNNKELVKSKN